MYEEEDVLDITELQHPLFKEGFELHYDEDIVVSFDDGQSTEDEILNFKVMTHQEQNVLRVEVTRESDIYWVLQFEISEGDFPNFAKKQPFKKINFDTFVQNLMRTLDNVKNNRSAYSAVLSAEDEEHFTLTLRQQLEFKRVDIFRITFTLLADDFDYTQDQAQHRYSYKLIQFEDAQNRLRELFDHIEKKNPQLCAQLRKGSKFSQK